MKTLRKIRKSTKALSPVVASIILIAVTVAVSIAVAAWMGALTIGFMGTEEVRITNVEFVTGHAMVTVRNTGSTSVTLSEAYVSGNVVDVTALPVSLDANGEATIDMPYAYVQGTAYQFKLVSAKGNPFVYTATAPNPIPAPAA
jgi:flagellin-like protein